jgi:hypothetical protein
MRFADIDFGPDDAKGDKRLGEYFLRIPEYVRVRVGKAWFIVGRKRPGKSAICQMLAQEPRADPTRFASRVSFKAVADFGADAEHSFTLPQGTIAESAQLDVRISTGLEIHAGWVRLAAASCDGLGLHDVHLGS